MNRREMLKYTAWLTGAAVSAPFASAFLSGCSPDSNSDVSGLHFFDPEQFDLVVRLADTILPRTDSPSASDVNVHYTIDSMLGLVFEENFKTTFRQQWSELGNYLDDQNFQELDASSQAELLSKLDLGSNGNGDARMAFKEFKQQVIACYLASEEIGKEYLNYLPIPGNYEPCISVDDVNNKAWAL